jgi:hypothetical protein
MRQKTNKIQVKYPLETNFSTKSSKNKFGRARCASRSPSLRLAQKAEAKA